jgi:hypothetical protein
MIPMLRASTTANDIKSIFFFTIFPPLFKIFSVLLDFDNLRRYSPPFGIKAAEFWFGHFASLTPQILVVTWPTISVSRQSNSGVKGD